MDRSHSSVEANAFNRNLDTLALGDEIAFKGGRGRLTYMGPDAVYVSYRIYPVILLF